MEEVSVIIPAYNEEDKIENTIRALQTISEIREIIVVDDGSLDQTAEIARNKGVTVIEMKKNTGKSSAVYQGLLQANCKVIALVDADLEDSAVEIKKLIYPVSRGLADMTIAHFKEEASGGGFGIVRRIAGFFLAEITGRSVKSPLSGQRVLNKGLLEHAARFTRGFGLEFGLTAISLQKGLKVIEVETDMYHRIHGKSIKGFIHRGRQLIDIIKVLFIIMVNKKEAVK